MNRCYSNGMVTGEEITANTILGAIGGAVDLLGVSQTYYNSKINNIPKALRNKDYEQEGVMGIDKSFKDFNEFNEWINHNNT